MVEKICGKVEQYALGRSRMLSSRCWQPFRELQGVSNSHLILQQMRSSSCPLLPIHFHLGEITVVRASRFAVNLPYFPELTTRETKKSRAKCFAVGQVRWMISETNGLHTATFSLFDFSVEYRRKLRQRRWADR